MGRTKSAIMDSCHTSITSKLHKLAMSNAMFPRVSAHFKRYSELVTASARVVVFKYLRKPDASGFHIGSTFVPALREVGPQQWRQGVLLEHLVDHVDELGRRLELATHLDAP